MSAARSVKVIEITLSTYATVNGAPRELRNKLSAKECEYGCLHEMRAYWDDEGNYIVHLAAGDHPEQFRKRVAKILAKYDRGSSTKVLRRA